MKAAKGWLLAAGLLAAVCLAGLGWQVMEPMASGEAVFWGTLAALLLAVVAWLAAVVCWRRAQTVLEHCPFCGGEALWLSEDRGSLVASQGKAEPRGVVCVPCGASGVVLRSGSICWQRRRPGQCPELVMLGGAK